MDGALSTRSPMRRLRALTASRQKWKDRVAAKHREIRSLRVKVRDLQVSRDLWKQRALATENSDAEAVSPGEAGPSQP
jgi:predicted  nucleic acid-binding Zn-ribbon protein